MIIVLKYHNNEEIPKLWKRINIDHMSFAIPKNDLKYYKNMVLLCGSDQSAHLQFDSPADRRLFL